MAEQEAGDLRSESAKIQENQSTSTGAESAGVRQPRETPWVPAPTESVVP